VVAHAVIVLVAIGGVKPGADKNDAGGERVDG
jgi:hypothetical protein